MRTGFASACLAAIVLACGAGCAQEDQARGLITVGLWNPGKTDQDMMAPLGSSPSEYMRKTGRIDLSARIEMPDKAPMDVWVIKARDAQGRPAAAAAGTILVLHALREGKASFPYSGVADRLAKKGYDVVLPDLRCHGYSGGEFITFGAKEKDDLKRVMDQFVGEKAVSDKVYVFGAGLGGCIGIQYAATDPRVQGVVVIAPYKDFRSYARQRCPLAGEADFQKIVETAGKIGSFDPNEASAVEAASKLTCPLLVIHGTLDFSVPMEWSQAVAEAAAGPKKLLVVNALELPFVGALYEDWIVGQVESLIQGGLKEPAPASKPAGNP